MKAGGFSSMSAKRKKKLSLVGAGLIRPAPGDGPLHSVTWLSIVGWGLVAGDSGRLIPTDAGKAFGTGHGARVIAYRAYVNC
jgi:hypothetical protein